MWILNYISFYRKAQNCRRSGSPTSFDPIPTRFTRRPELLRWFPYYQTICSHCCSLRYLVRIFNFSDFDKRVEMYWIPLDGYMYLVWFFRTKSPVVIMGAHAIREKEPEQVQMTGKRVIVHKDYSPVTLDNDIALIELPQDVSFNSESKYYNFSIYISLDPRFIINLFFL